MWLVVVVFVVAAFIYFVSLLVGSSGWDWLVVDWLFTACVYFFVTCCAVACGLNGLVWIA